MDELIEAFQIFLKYGNVKYPTHCEHDVLYVYPNVSPAQFSVADIDRLEKLGFIVNVEDDADLEEAEGFMSFKYGSC